MLPKNEKVERSTSQGLHLWLYGGPGVGKTYFATHFPNPLLISTDSNYRYTDVPAIPISDWDSFVEAVDDVIKGYKTEGYETIIVDLLEDVYTFCKAKILGANKIEHESDLQWGKGYDLIRTPFLASLTKLLSLPIRVIFISHESEKIVRNRIGKETTHYGPSSTLSEKVASKIEGKVAYTLRAYYEETAIEEGKVLQTRSLSIIPKSNEFGINRYEELFEEDSMVLDADLFTSKLENKINLTHSPTKVISKKTTDSVSKKETKLKPKQPVSEPEEVAPAKVEPVKVESATESVEIEEVKPVISEDKKARLAALRAKQNTKVEPAEVVDVIEESTKPVIEATETPTKPVEDDRSSRLAALRNKYKNAK